MVRTRRESHHHDGITDPKDLQLPFATKSARSGLVQCSKTVSMDHFVGGGEQRSEKPGRAELIILTR
jgi:hypothetical protein